MQSHLEKQRCQSNKETPTVFPFHTTPKDNIGVRLRGAQITSISRSMKSFHSKNIACTLCLVLQDTKREANNYQEDNLTKTP
jgi:hypothetical protein